MAMMSDRFDPHEEIPMAKVQELVFEKVRLSTTGVISLSALEIINHSSKFSLREQISTEILNVGRQIVLGLVTELASGKMQDVTRRTYMRHNSIWQMFKEKYMPKWFIRKYPIKKEQEVIEVTTNFYFVCPHIMTDKLDRHVRFMSIGKDWVNR